MAMTKLGSVAHDDQDGCLPENDGIYSFLKQKPDTAFNKDIFTDRTLHNNTKLYPVSWTNPDILASSSAYSVYKRSHMPSALTKVIVPNAANYKHINAYASCRDRYILLTNRESAILYVCSPQLDNAVNDFMMDFELPIPADTPNAPFALTIPSENGGTRNLPGVLIVTVNGKIRYWSSGMLTTRKIDDFQTHQLPLASTDKVTCVSQTSTHQATIGTMSGDVFILNTRDEFGRVALTTMSLYKKSGFSSLLVSFLPTFPGLSFLSNYERPERKDSVIKVVDERDTNEITILSSYHMFKWRLTDGQSAELISKVAITPAIRDCLPGRVLPKGTGRNVDIHVLDIDRHRSNSWALLVSYSVSEMKGYSQFAIVIVSDIGVSSPSSPRTLDNVCDKFESLYKISECISLPYSAVLKDMTRRPTLTMSKSGPAAFVTFADTVVATSVDRRSLFEESVILKNPHKNTILCTAVAQRLSTESAYDASTLAYILTAQSGLLIFKIDNQKILGKKSEGNIYASAQEDGFERDVEIAKSRIEQAVYFGENEESPLTFPLQSDLNVKARAEAARLLLEEILHGSSPPKISTMDTRMLLKNRLLMITRMLNVLKANGLFKELGHEYQRKIIENVEHCYVATELWQMYTEKRSSDVGMSGVFNNMWMMAVQEIYPQKSSADVVMRHFLSVDVPKIPEFLNHLKNQVRKSGEHTQQDQQYKKALYELNTTILHIVNAARKFEAEHFSDYSFEKDSHFWSVQQSKLLGEVFELTSNMELESTAHLTCSDAEPIQRNVLSSGSSTFDSKLQRQLYDVGDLLLDLLSKTNSSASDSDTVAVYKDTRKWIIEVLCKVGCQKDALILAEKHGDFSVLIETAQFQGSAKARKQLEHYLGIFGKEFAFQLFQWYIDHDSESELLQLGPSYNDLLSEFLTGKKTKVSWRHYMRMERYKLALDALNDILPLEDRLAEKKVLLSNAKLLHLALMTEGPGAITVPLALASPRLSLIAVSLALVEAEEGIIAEFNKVLERPGTPEKTIDKAKVIVEHKAMQLKNSGRLKQLKIFTDLVGNLLKGKMLSCEDFISVLILMDKDSRGVRHFLLALRFARAMMRSDAERHTILNKIWQQVYLKDNWEDLWHCKAKWTDAQLYVRLRQTTLYYLLDDCEKDGVRDDDIMRPGDLVLGSNSEEDEALKTSISKHGLESFFDEILCILQGKKTFPDKLESYT